MPWCRKFDMTRILNFGFDETHRKEFSEKKEISINR